MSKTHERQTKIYFSPLNFVLFKSECRMKNKSYSSEINNLLNEKYSTYTQNEKQQLREFFERNLKK